MIDGQGMSDSTKATTQALGLSCKASLRNADNQCSFSRGRANHAEFLFAQVGDRAWRRNLVGLRLSSFFRRAHETNRSRRNSPRPLARFSQSFIRRSPVDEFKASSPRQPGRLLNRKKAWQRDNGCAWAINAGVVAFDFLKVPPGQATGGSMAGPNEREVGCSMRHIPAGT
jgi:hypothetical protein